MSATTLSPPPIKTLPPVTRPEARRVDLPSALLSMWRLTRNKEDTSQVFKIVRAMNGDTLSPAFDRFCASQIGRRLMEEPNYYFDALDDRDALRALPPDTVGRHYLAFMESDDLETNGILEIMADSGFDYWPLAKAHPWWHAFTWANNLTHDLYHVLTGYARDAIGEAAVQAITGHTTGARGSTFIGVLGGLECRRAAPGVPVGKMMREANRIGAGAADLVTTDMRELLPLPLDEARRRLNLQPPLLYWSVGRDVLDSILKPKTA